VSGLSTAETAPTGADSNGTARAAQVQTTAAGAPEAPAAPLSDEAEAFASRLRSLAHSHKEIAAGAISVSGLDHLRDEIGARWERISSHVCQTTEAILNKRLGPNDAFVRQGELDYVIAFADMTGDDAKMKVVVIGHEILHKLFGENPDQYAVRLHTCAADIDAKCAQDEEDPAHAIADKLDEIDAVELAVRKAAPGRKKRSAPRVATPNPVRAEPPSISCEWRGIWDRRRTTVLSYACWPSMLKSSEREISLLDDHMEIELTCDDLLAIDLAAFAAVADQFRQMEEQELWCQLVCPIHFETLASSQRRRVIADAYAVINDPARRYLAIELVGVPAGTPTSRLIDLCNHVRPYCGAIYFRFESQFRGNASLRECGILGGTLDLSAEQAPDRFLIRRAWKFAFEMNSMRRRSLVHMPARPDLLKQVAQAYVDMMSGQNLSSGEGMLVPYRCTFDDLADAGAEDAQAAI
jgi:hypothetical protein